MASERRRKAEPVWTVRLLGFLTTGTALNLYMCAMLIRGRPFTPATYRARRQRALALVARQMFRPLPLLILGCDELHLRRDRQDPWFDYYTGCHEPDAAVLLDPSGPNRDTLFLETGDPARVIWDGPRLAPGAAARAAFAVDNCRPHAELLPAVIAAARRHGGALAVLLRSREPGWQNHQALHWKALLAPEIMVANAEPALVHQRMIKSADEVAWHREAIRRTAVGLRAVLPRIPKLLQRESDIAAELICHYRRYGYDPLAFPPIVGAGVHAATLHYPFNDQPLGDARCILIDSGATAGGYCADITRTLPRNGRFTDKRFTALYELCLRANALGRAHARPGMSREQLNDLAWKPIIAAGFTRHHGLWHHIGLDVHDPADYAEPLQPGMIISNEPGIYLPAEGIGIRIEDDLLITTNGCEDLSAAIPKTRAGIEAWMASTAN